MKTLFIILLSVFALSLNAQYVHSATTKMDAAMIPSGFSRPSVTAITDEEKTRHDWTINLPGSLDNATQATAMTAIIAAVKDSVLQRALNVWAVDTSDLHLVSYLTECRRGYKEFSIGDFTNQYKVGTDVFKCKGYSEWIKN